VQYAVIIRNIVDAKPQMRAYNQKIHNSQNTQKESGRSLPEGFRAQNDQRKNVPWLSEKEAHAEDNLASL
jgi:hypothetical protein